MYVKGGRIAFSRGADVCWRDPGLHLIWYSRAFEKAYDLRRRTKQGVETLP